MSQESPIFIKTQNFEVWLLERTEKFRKPQRFVMGSRLQKTILDFQETLIIAANFKDPIKHLKKADILLQLLRRHIRTCVDLKLLTFQQYEYASNNLVEIGKLLGGWMKKYYKTNEDKDGSPVENSGDRVGFVN